jgi:hypothetical protein
MIIDAIYGAFVSYVKIALIIIPVLIVMEVLRDLNVIEVVTKLLHPLISRFKIADEGTFLVAIGMVFGLTYGSGVIIQSAKDGHLDNRSLVVVGVFLATCHALVEDTALFSAMGANVLIIMAVRFSVATLMSYLVSRKIGESKKIA